VHHLPARKSSSRQTAGERLLDYVRRRGGVVTRRELAGLGHRSSALEAALASGELKRIAHGVYRLADALPFGLEASFAQAMLAVKSGVIALRSALAYYQLTTEIPLEVDLAVARRTQAKQVEVPIRIIPMPLSRFTHEVSREHTAGGETFRIFSAERSICDAFAYAGPHAERITVPEEIAYEALRSYLAMPTANLRKLAEQARFTNTTHILEPVLRVHGA
jgi:predicted transcriptional regulator of viral defense system